MKSSRYLFGALVAACLFAASAVQTSARAVFDVAVATGRAFKNLVLDGFALAANAQADKARTVLPFVQAKAFKQRKEKRERPLMTADWRMCPST